VETIFVDGEHLKGFAAYPEHMLTGAIKEVLEENFEISDN
jgi:hypothetical protein